MLFDPLKHLSAIATYTLKVRSSMYEEKMLILRSCALYLAGVAGMVSEVYKGV